MAQQERFVVSLVDEDLGRVLSFPDLLYLEATWNENAAGALSMRLPVKYCDRLIELGILDNSKGCMPSFWLLVYRVAGGTCELWEKQAWLIDKALNVQRSDGTCYIQIEADCATGLLSYRSIFAPRDDDDSDPPVNTNIYTNHSGTASVVMCDIFEQQFGDAQGLDNAKAPAVRDWITAGCVAKGEVKDETGAVVDPAVGCGADCSPQLDYRGTLLEIFNECADASAAEDQPLFFEMVPTCTPGQYGDVVSLPIVLNICCGHRGEDRSVGNAQGNKAILLSDRGGSLAAFTLGPDYGGDYSVAMTAGVDDDGNSLTSILCDNDRTACTKWGWKEAIQVDQDAQEQAIVNSANAAFLEQGNKSGEVVAEFANTRGVCINRDFGAGDCVTIEQKCVRTDVRITSVNVKCENGETKYRLKFSAVE